MRVRCYYNLRKKCLSVQYKGKVILHTDSIYLRDVKFIVRQSGRLRVLQTKHKNVHAFVEGNIYIEELGILIFPSACDFDCNVPVTYNPYLNDSFVTESGNIITKCKEVYISNKAILANIKA